MSGSDRDAAQPGRWTQVRELFEACLGQSLAQREQALAAAPEPIAREVRALLAEVALLPGEAGPLADLLPTAPPDPDPTRAPGERIGDYDIRGVIATGGMSVVLLAEQREPRRLVALKILRADLPSAGALRRFRDEAAILARLRHPGIAQVLQAGIHEAALAGVRLQRPWFAMELVEGARTLRQFVAETPLDRAARLGILLAICDAVEHGHQRGIIHRDLKPENVLVGGDAVVKLIDFGVARVLGREVEPRLPATQTGDFVGTLVYASPEQLSGDPAQVDTRSDVYSLGVLAFELLTGELPYADAGRGVAAVADAIVRGDTRPARSVASDLPVDLDAILGKALSFRPDRRYSTAGALAADLRRFLRHDTVDARLPTMTYQLARLARRHWPVVAALATVLVVSVAATVISSLFARDARLALGERDVAARLARDRLAAVLQLAHQAELDALVREAHLLPIAPVAADLPAVQAWLARAAGLERHLPALRAQVAAIRAGGIQRAGHGDRLLARQHAAAAQAVQVERERHRILETGPVPLTEARRLELGARLWLLEAQAGRLAARLERTATYEFVGDDMRSGQQITWHHDLLATLVADLEEFVADAGSHPLVLGVHGDTMPAVRRRLGLIADADAEQAAALGLVWQRAVAEIRADPVYGGLDLPPQPGLIPLGRDPASGLHEFAMPATGAVPMRGGDGVLARSVDACLIFVLLPGGMARIGDVSPQAGRSPSSPAHEVRLEPFLLAKYEMTQAQWLRMFGDNDSFHHAGANLLERDSPPANPPASAQVIRRDNPVTNVSRDDLLARLPRLGLALPTEVQWEYACRAGTTDRFWWGDGLAGIETRANFRDRAARSPSASWDDGFYSHAPVGTMPANPFGLHDMLGNVAEHCADAYYTYGAVAARPGDGLRQIDQGFADRFCVRGGGFWQEPVGSAWRGHVAATETLMYVGVRPLWPIRR